ncbi:hypothetical protein [Microbacterium sp. C7(2022)]|uniref:hypothetical protein n=1 Tax=Microbacterium sp. C7(2022) TaxID=2992759 RepID=UPI00237B2BA1|nr:hypothetical protein [Microbacterium sp. C7(2022)]MDE0545433.1 hypothetical protein [Microbacterium sp. C7(2022)]
MSDDERMPPPADPPVGAAPGESSPAPAAESSPAAPAAPAPEPAPAPASARTRSEARPRTEGAPEDRPHGVASTLPGAHRGGFTRLPTAPTPITSQSAPKEPGTDTDPTPVAQWLMPAEAPPYRGLAGWALGFAIIGLVVSLFVGWGFPIGLVAIVSAIIALFRPLESRAIAVWAIVLGSVSVIYSAGWLIYAANVANIWG